MDQIWTCPLDSFHAVTTGREESDDVELDKILLKLLNDSIPGLKYGILGLWNTKMTQQKLWISQPKVECGQSCLRPLNCISIAILQFN